MGDFAHLHVHTEYSLLDGQTKIKSGVARAVENGQPALAITDHGALYGAVPFYRACLEAGIKPIIGLEAYQTHWGRNHTDRDKILDAKPFHLLLLAKNQQGYQNLLKLSSISHKEGFYNRPRVSHDLLTKYGDGLIVTSGCVGAELANMILQGEDKLALERAGWYREVFGDDFYLEMQYRSTEEQIAVNKWVAWAVKEHGFKPVITTDAHYTNEQDWDTHDTLLCIQTGGYKTQTYEERMMFDERETYSLLSTQAMIDYAKQYDMEEAVYNTIEVADKTNVTIGGDGYKLPEFHVPDGHTHQSFLELVCENGLNWRYGDSWRNDLEITERLEKELRIINSMGFDSYFLVVWDVIMFCMVNDIFFNVRGSGAGSIVAYALGITSVDPLEHDLIFERFLNPSRISMPDIDLDTQDDKRALIMQYLVSQYGSDRVAGIVTFGTLGGKSAINDVGRALNVPKEEISKVTKYITPFQGKHLPLPDYVKMYPELAMILDKSEDLLEVYRVATELQGRVRHASTHAAGVLITPMPIDEFIPVRRLTGKSFAGTGLDAISQWDMEVAEWVGALKLDLLGLSTLTAMRVACDYIYERHGVRWDLDNIPYRHTGDKEMDGMLDGAFELISRGETAGVFQIEGSGLTSMFKEMKPRAFANITAGISLYRPGPMGVDAHNIYIRRLHGEESPTYYDERLKPILEETYGLLVYQEQVMKLAVTMAGYEEGESDSIRKAVGKKKAKELAKHYEKFITQGVANGFSEEVVNEVWEAIEYFAGYGFNKAHGTDYAKLTVQTAFLKAHYPIEYMTALLQVYLSKPDKLGYYLDECRSRMGIAILPPSVNYSQKNFSIEQTDTGEAIRIGFTAIKNVKDTPSDLIINGRNGKPFENMGDFASRVSLPSINKTAHQHLIQAGAMDCFGERDVQLHTLEPFRKSLQKRRRAKKKLDGVPNLLDILGVKEEIDDIDLTPFMGDTFEPMETIDILRLEYESIGFYVSARPTDEYRDAFRQKYTSSAVQLTNDEINEQFEGEIVSIGGEVISIHPHIDKNQNQMLFIEVEDWHDTAGKLEVTVFASMWKLPTAKLAIQRGAMVVIKGKMNRFRGDMKMAALEVWRVDKEVHVKPKPRKQASHIRIGW